MAPIESALVIVAPMADVLRPLFDQVVIKEIDPERLLVCRVREILGVIETGPSPDDPTPLD